MFVSPISATLILTAVVTYFIYIKWLRSKYPPGPWPLPVIGNLHLLSENPYLDLARLERRFGPIFTVWMGWQPTVILCDLKSIQEATIRKGMDFAGRSMDVNGFKQIFHNNEDFLSRSYDRKVETMRKLALSVVKSKSLGGSSIQKIVESEMLEMMKLARDTNEETVDPYHIVHVPVSNTLMMSIFDMRFKNERDPEFMKWTKVVMDMKIAFDKAILVNFFPPLWYIWANARDWIRKALTNYDQFIDSHLVPHEERYQEGIVRDLADSLLNYRANAGKDDVPLTRLNVSELIKDLLGAGTLTVTSGIMWAFLVLLHHPEIQARIKQDLDKCKAMSNPTEEEQEESNASKKLFFSAASRPHCPYLNAFLYEIFRRCPVAPLALPHKTMSDTTVGGYSIPKDTPVTFNIYSCHMDEKVWEKPSEFNPERFLDANGQLDHLKANRLMTFSAGPRSCPGENLAKMEIFTCLANVLYVFKLNCKSVRDLPSLDDGHFRLECSPRHYEMSFQKR